MALKSYGYWPGGLRIGEEVPSSQEAQHEPGGSQPTGERKGFALQCGLAQAIHNIYYIYHVYHIYIYIRWDVVPLQC